MASLHPQDSTDGNAGASTHRSASPRVPNSSTSRSAQQLAHGVNSLITSHKNALAQHNNVTSNNSSIPQLSHHTNGVKSGKTPSSNYSTGHVKLIDSNASSQKQYVARRDGDKSATADSHISQLKMVNMYKYVYNETNICVLYLYSVVMILNSQPISLSISAY